MSSIDHINSIISKCNDLGLAIEVHEVQRELIRSTEFNLLQDELAQAQESLDNAKIASERRTIEAETAQRSSKQNINKIRDSQRQLEESILDLENQLKLNSKKIIEGSSDVHRLLLRHIRLASSISERWSSLPKKILAAITEFLDHASIRFCSAVCKLWRYNLQFSDVYQNILKRRLLRRLPRKTVDDQGNDHRIAIRIYFGESSGNSNSIAFDKSLAQLQNENERVAAEHDATISNLGKAESLLAELQNDIKVTRQRYGALSLVRSDQINELRDLAKRKKLLVSQTAEIDRKLSDKRFQNVEAFLQLQEEMQLQIAESRRLDAVDRELNRLKEAFVAAHTPTSY